MKERTIRITMKGNTAALASLDRADGDARFAKKLKTRFLADRFGPDPEIAALNCLIAFALVNPGGNIERILRKRGFLTPEIIKGYEFSEGSH